MAEGSAKGFKGHDKGERMLNQLDVTLESPRPFEGTC